MTRRSRFVIPKLNRVSDTVQRSGSCLPIESILDTVAGVVLWPVSEGWRPTPSLWSDPRSCLALRIPLAFYRPHGGYIAKHPRSNANPRDSDAAREGSIRGSNKGACESKESFEKRGDINKVTLFRGESLLAREVDRCRGLFFVLSVESNVFLWHEVTYSYIYQILFLVGYRTKVSPQIL